VDVCNKGGSSQVGVSQVGYEYISTTMSSDDLININQAIQGIRAKTRDGNELRAMKALFKDKWQYCGPAWLV
jgi:hypothetical protein